MQGGRGAQVGQARQAYFESADASFSDKCCEVSSTKAMAVGTGTHSCHIHIHRQGRLPCQGLQNGPPALRGGQRHIQDLVQPSRPVTNVAHLPLEQPSRKLADSAVLASPLETCKRRSMLTGLFNMGCFCSKCSDIHSHISNLSD